MVCRPQGVSASPNPVRTSALYLFLGTALTSTSRVAAQQPTWSQVELPGTAMDYYLYWSGEQSAQNTCPAGQVWDHNCAVVGTTAATIGTPAHESGSYNHYKLTAGSLTPPAIYWFVYNENPAPDGNYDDKPALEYTVTGAGYTGVSGLSFNGYILPGALAYPTGGCNWAPSTAYPYSCPFAITAVFASQSKSFYNDQEYGFYMDTTKSVDGTQPGIPWVFYYSQYTNANGQLTSNLVQLANITLCAGCGPGAHFEAYIASKADGRHYFEISVKDSASSLATCQIMVSSSINSGTLSPPAACQYSLGIHSWWSAANMASSTTYLAVNTEVAPVSTSPSDIIGYSDPTNAGLAVQSLFLATGSPPQ